MNNITPGFSTAFRVLRGRDGQWQVVEEGKSSAVASFEAPQAALSFACSIAEARNGSLVVVFDEPRRPRLTMRAGRNFRLPSAAVAYAGQAS